jgi:hypothetical protein
MVDAMTPLTDQEAARVVEVYKAYLADVGTVGTRHTEANKLYVSPLSALFVLLGLTMGKGDHVLPESLQQWLYVLAIVLSFAWSLQVWVYATLYGAKFSVLLSIEASLPVQPFTLQSKLLGAYLPVTIVERFVALIITVPFLVMLRQTHPLLTSLFWATEFGLFSWLRYDYLKWRKKNKKNTPTPQ